MLKATHAVAALAAIAALSGSGGVANAGGAHLRLHKFHSFNHFYSRPVIVIGAGGCEYYYDMWLDTGRPYWKRKYYRCMGWW